MCDSAAQAPELPDVLSRLAAALERLDAGDAEGLDPAAAAKFIGVSVSKIHQMNVDGQVPAPVQLGDRCPRWVRSELKAWMLAGCPARLRWQSVRAAALRHAS